MKFNESQKKGPQFLLLSSQPAQCCYPTLTKTLPFLFNLEVGGHCGQRHMLVLVSVLVHKQIFFFGTSACAATATCALGPLRRHLFVLVSRRNLACAVHKLLDESPQAVVVLNAGHFESVVVGATQDGEIFPVGAAHGQVVQCTHVDRRHQLVRVACDEQDGHLQVGNLDVTVPVHLQHEATNVFQEGHQHIHHVAHREESVLHNHPRDQGRIPLGQGDRHCAAQGTTK
mmetsp:Transcript_36069/g.62169  ORF Transcript_36069/g.62169 Transcript_36069/m.62169 type:complete len:229 (-) Transcript_36069:64-750(-)